MASLYEIEDSDFQRESHTTEGISSVISSLQEIVDSHMHDVIVQKVKAQLTDALEKICQQSFSFTKYVSVTGTLVFIADDSQVTEVSVSENVFCESYIPELPVAEESVVLEDTTESNVENEPIEPAAEETEKKPDVIRLRLSLRNKSSAGSDSSSPKRKRGRPRKSDSVLKNKKSDKKSQNIKKRRKRKDKTDEVDDTEAVHEEERQQPPQCKRGARQYRQMIAEIEDTSDVINVKVEKSDDDLENEDLANDSDEAMLQIDIPVKQPDEDPLQCNKCDFEAESEEPLRQHRLERHGALPCMHCPHVEDKRSKLNAHIESYHDDMAIDCDECKEKLPNIKALREHLKTVHCTRWRCVHCDLPHPTKQLLHAHVEEDHLEHADAPLLTCDKCELMYGDNEKLNQHMQDKHTYRCDCCEASFPNASRLATHRMKDHPDKALECALCGRKLPTRSALVKHIMRHKEKQSGGYSCDICHKTFTAKSTLYHHKRGIHEKTNYPCREGCGKVFKCRTTLYRHEKGPEHMLGPGLCSSCGESFKSNVLLSKHVNTVHMVDNEKRKMYTCRKGCDKAFYFRSTRWYHEMGPVHGGAVPETKVHYCACGQSFQTVTMLRQHRITAHNTDKQTFKCRKGCGKVFLGRTTRWNHEKGPEHGNRKDYSCFCGKSFGRYALWSKHQTTMHGTEEQEIVADEPKEQTYTCRKGCDKVFTCRSTRWKHERGAEHGHEESHRCICGDTFRTFFLLSQHQIAAHGPEKQTFECRKGCDQVFNNRTTRWFHETGPAHGQAGRHGCTCGKSFQTHSLLKRHQVIAHGAERETYKCRKGCGRVFNGRSRRWTHETHAHEGVHTCSSCGESFKRMPLLYKHRITAHGVAKKAYACRMCNKEFTTIAGRSRHEKGVAHGNERTHHCHCGKSFCTPNDLRGHQAQVHTPKLLYTCTHCGYRCEECGETFNFHHSLKLHTYKHTGRRPYPCEQCSKAYLTASHLKDHVEAVHSGTRKFKCHICDKAFPYENSLRMHTLLHNEDRPFCCDMCGKMFVSKSALKTHEELHSDETYKCEVCDKVYRTRGLLRAHQRRHTRDGHRYMCDICGNTFMYASTLQAHKAVHGSERAYKCNICDAEFKTNATLYSHRLVHTSDNPFRCKTCGKAFKTKERMKAHERRHLGDKPFSCNLCGSTFPDRGGLSKHNKTVHATSPRFKCPVCGKLANRADNLRVHMKVHNDPKLLKLTQEELVVKDVSLPDTAAAAAEPKVPPLPKRGSRGRAMLQYLPDTPPPKPGSVLKPVPKVEASQAIEEELVIGKITALTNFDGLNNIALQTQPADLSTHAQQSQQGHVTVYAPGTNADALHTLSMVSSTNGSDLLPIVSVQPVNALNAQHVQSSQPLNAQVESQANNSVSATVLNTSNMLNTTNVLNSSNVLNGASVLNTTVGPDGQLRAIINTNPLLTLAEVMSSAHMQDNSLARVIQPEAINFTTLQQYVPYSGAEQMSQPAQFTFQS